MVDAMQRLVAVTGAGGFLGAAVTRRLAECGHRVRAHLGPPGVPLAAPPAGTATLVADITDQPALDGLVEGCDVVIHLAGPPSVAASFAAAAEYARVHVVGTATVLQACEKSRVRRVVYVSSAEVYGRPRTAPVHEDHPRRPRSPYGAAKVGAEALVTAWSAAAGTKALILRPFSVYGPELRSTSLLGSLLAQVLSTPAVRLADLTPVRDYCYVADVAAAVEVACTVATFEPVVTVNVGSGVGISVAGLAHFALTCAGRDLPVEQVAPDRPLDAGPGVLVADTDRAARVLGWRASTSLADGLSRTLTWLAHPGEN